MVHLILHNKFSFTELWAQVLDWSQCPGNPGCINTQQARQWQHYKLAHLYIHWPLLWTGKNMLYCKCAYIHRNNALAVQHDLTTQGILRKQKLLQAFTSVERDFYLCKISEAVRCQAKFLTYYDYC